MAVDICVHWYRSLFPLPNRNEYIVALVMISDPAKQTVPVGVAALFEVQRYSTDWGALFAALVLVLIPTVVLYAIGQRYLIEGINVGGVKG